MFLDSFSHQWCHSRLFSMLVTAPPQPKHNTVCPRLLSLTFPIHCVQGCKWHVCVYQCSLHVWKCISQTASKDLSYKCHIAVPPIFFGHVLIFLNSHRLVNCPKGSTYIQVNRLKVLEQTATHSRFCSSVSGLLTCYLL